MEREGLPFATLTVLTLAMTACVAGAGGPSPTDPHLTTTTTLPTTTTTLTMEEALAAYRACLADEGVSIGEIRVDGLGRPRMADALSGLDLTDQSVLDALEACGGHISSGPLALDADPELAQLVRQRLGEFAECVRLEGVPGYPDPVPDFDGVGSPFPINQIPWRDPGLPDAVDACNEVLGN